MKQWFVYILANGMNGTLYVGVTNNLTQRISEHKTAAIQSFTQKYAIHDLVYYETLDSPEDAIRREKNIKAWQRLWKLRLINETNPEWKDLSDSLLD